MLNRYLLILIIFLSNGLCAQQLILEKKYDYIEYIGKNHIVLNDETIEFNDINHTFYHHYTNDCCDYKGKGRYYIQDSTLTLEYEFFPLEENTRNAIYVVNDNNGTDSTYIDFTLILRENSSSSRGTTVLINDSLFYLNKYGKLKYDLYSPDDSVMITIQLFGQEKKIPLIGIKNKFIYIVSDYNNDCKNAVIEYQSRQFKIRKIENSKIIEFIDNRLVDDKWKVNKIIDLYYLSEKVYRKKTKRWTYSFRI